MRLSKRCNISPSLTLAMNTRAKSMKAQGINVLSFAAGEPDFYTPIHVKEAGKKAIDENKTYYTPASGIIELKKAIIKKFEKDNDLSYTVDEVTVNSGAKHTVFNALWVLVEERDEVIIPAPYWVSYSEMVKICGGTPVFINTTEKTGFKITPFDLEKVITKKTKVLLLNYPCNPTGAVYSKNELFKMAEFIEDKDIIIIADEIYEKILYDGLKHVSIATYSEKIKGKSVIVNGVSKAFSMTGWRIGYAAGPKAIIAAINKIQGHTTGNPSSISQWASFAGLTNDTSFISGWVEEFKKRRDYIVDKLNDIKGFSCLKPHGAFYVFPGVKECFGKVLNGYKINDSVDLANYLLEYGKIAVVPGKAFGADSYIRISFATSMENIVEGVERLKNAIG